MDLSYNRNIFTKVNKWDNEYSYNGILVSGKFNQLNGQGYKILDVIDLDWDGAYINNLNSYVYTTEDLIKVLDKYAGNFSYIGENYVKYSYLNEFITETNENIENLIDEKSIEIQSYVLNSVIEALTFDYDILNSISDLILDRTKYIEINYEDIDFNDATAEYYIYEDNEYKSVDFDYIRNHPDQKYYEFLIKDIIKLQKNYNILKDIVGTIEYNEIDDSYTYTGIQEDIYNINNDISYLTEYTDESYYYAYNAYNTANVNKERIGYHSRYNIYEVCEDPANYEGQLYVYSNGGYTPTTYNPLYMGKYYVYYPKIDGAGIEKELEDIKDKISNSTIEANNLDPENVIFNIYNDGLNNKKIINLGINKSELDKETGDITYGIVTTETLIDSFSYVYEWKIL